MATIKLIKCISYACLLFVIISLIACFFLLTLYRVPTDSMANTILPDDVIVVLKKTWEFEDKTDSQLGAYNLDSKKPKQRTYNRIVNGDNLVFRADRSNLNVVKRCVGIPGDTIRIFNAVLSVNSKRELNNWALYDYRMIANGDTVNLWRVFMSLGISKSQISQVKKGSFVLTLTECTAQKLMKTRFCKRINKIVKLGGNNAYIFPNNKKSSWSRDNYGPLIVPKKGQILFLNSLTYPIYENLILLEGHSVKKWKDKFVIDNKISGCYEVSNNYYFVMGDNRDRSNDSRWTGFVSSEQIIGKVIFVLRARWPFIFFTN